MTSHRNEDADDQALLTFLAAQRDAVLSIVRHAGHLDIARELLDGQTGLGAR